MMDERFERAAAVVPSLNPDEKLKKTVNGLLDVGFCRVILVDDGSAEEHKERFTECAKDPRVILLTHEVNRGKGAAMKTAFRYILENLPDTTGAVTVDGDGQHLPEDCRACCEKMLTDDKVVLGVRDFSLPDVPKRSRRGNRITSAVFKIFCGMKISDTQTGLRAFPKDVLPQMLQTKGDRYEYETQMLLDFKTYNIPFEENKIKTVYIEENQTSHFRVFRDSFRIYKMILAHFFKYSLSSIVAFLLESLIIFLILGTPKADLFTNTYAFLIARAVSSFFNMTVNYFVVFKAKCSYGRAALKYYALAVPVAAVTLGLDILLKWAVREMNFLPEPVENRSLVVINMIVQAVVFIVTFKLQQAWVYRTDKKHQLNREKKAGEDE